MAKGDKLARGRITIVNLNDGADAVVIYTRSQFQPTTPTGANPAGWSATPSTYDSNYWTLWASSAKKNADGTLAGSWSAPVPAELYDSNALGRFPFVVGTGNQIPYIPYSSTDNIREVGLNPFGVSDVLWRGKSQISTGWCGGFNLSSYVPVETDKLYRFACWFKRSTFTEGASTVRKSHLAGLEILNIFDELENYFAISHPAKQYLQRFPHVISFRYGREGVIFEGDNQPHPLNFEQIESVVEKGDFLMFTLRNGVTYKASVLSDECFVNIGKSATLS